MNDHLQYAAPFKDVPVLVTGATGFTGSLLTRRLVEAGARVTAIARESSNLSALQDLDVNWVRGQIFDPEIVKQAATDVEYIFHVAAAYREAKYADLMYRRVHVESTQLLANTAVKNPKFKRFMHISTVGVLGHIAQPPANENTPLNPGDIYQATKAEAELWLRDFAPAANLPFTILRPAAIYGPGDTRLLKFFKMAVKPYLFLIGRSRGLYHLVHVEDLVNILMLAAIHPAASGEVFICGNPKCVTLEEMAHIVANEAGTSFRVVRLPAAPLFFAADICEWLCRHLGVEPPIHRRRLAFFTKDRSFDTSKLRERLGYAMLHTNQSGLAATARWYMEQGWLRQAKKTLP